MIVKIERCNNVKACSWAMASNRPIGLSAAHSVQNSRPSTPVGELCPPKPDARSNDFSKILPSYSLNTHISAPAMEKPQATRSDPEKDTAMEEPRKLIANIPATVLANLRSTCEEKAKVSLLDRIHGKHPGLKALTAWAQETLHSSLSLLSLKTNNLFEVTFSHPEGRIHALTQTELVCDTTAIFFSCWRPHFDSKALDVEENWIIQCGFKLLTSVRC